MDDPFPLNLSRLVLQPQYFADRGNCKGMDIFPSDESKLILFGMATSGPKKAIAYSRGPDR